MRERHEVHSLDMKGVSFKSLMAAAVQFSGLGQRNEMVLGSGQLEGDTHVNLTKMVVRG